MLALALALLAAAPDPSALRTGDVVLIRSKTAQAEAIAAATRSEATHVGVVIVEDGAPWVYEAAGTVRKTPWASFVARAKAGSLDVRRHPALADGAHELEEQQAIRWQAHKLLGTKYDLAFASGDDALYCSEFVRKVIGATGLEVGTVEHVRDLDLEHPAVKKLVAARWRKHPACSGASSLRACMPKLLEAEIVTPASLARDPNLERVFGPTPDDDEGAAR
jgi:hypothetical protein